jgi:hypothetical protein
LRVNTCGEFSLPAGCATPNMGMDVYQIRRRRLFELISTRFEGRQVDFAHAIGRQPNYISRCLSDNPAHRKKIGEKLARHIEDILDLPLLWMDNEGPSMGTHIPAISDKALQVAISYEQLSPEQRAAVDATLKAFKAESPPEDDPARRDPLSPSRH